MPPWSKTKTIYHSCISSLYINSGLPRWFSGKEFACQAGDMGLIPGLGRFSEEGNGKPLQYSCLENAMYRGTWRATVHGVTKSQTLLSDYTTTITHQSPQGNTMRTRDYLYMQ